MKFLLDTNICIYVIKQKPLRVKETLQNIDPREIGLSIITLAELEYGAAKSQNPQRNRETLTRFYLPFQIVGFRPEDAQKFGEIRAKLERRGQPIGSYDLLIASQAVNRELILVTNNIKEFSRVEGLNLENWVE
ncbi:type II toxin-antitoxin system VapC family toxin [Roseofilum sp. BLCC_M91]|jgi:tRNA(fMet)-specific endonuclease VapC|uniref:Type II toxin-antitoxin system VapC family toxin n=1 Tax=Roseofilum halophilum BLCC-M91 TaxID=3022259 RepID=A0ABT7BK47_9CYAN|nr:type II toxin-antitoxin system VapC family toxin [Roseofilum halophilum]MDJ1179563.1 type II toxin-antitoxin system VapC family toxin [Roseofilum halophilum BLCC-M91]